MKFKIGLFLFFSVAILSPCEAFWAVNDDKGGTHRKITEHAIAEIPKNEYPDIDKYADTSLAWLKRGIYAGAGNEDSHNHHWRGNWEYWEKKAVATYELGFFDDAYTMIGNAMHLYQDDEVPAHKKYCFHGLGSYYYVDMPNHGGIGNSDRLENFALYDHREISNATHWDAYYQDPKGNRRKYWLNDAEDEDLGEGGWGAYGAPKEEFTPITTDNCRDWYTDDEKISYGTLHPEIAWGQLYEAKVVTRDNLRHLSQILPPLLRQLQLSGKSKLVKGETCVFVGPKHAQALSFQCLENRTQQVHVDIRLKETNSPIKTGTSLVWDQATATLKEGKELPWEYDFDIKWKGETAAGKAKDGKYHLVMEITDGDKNILPKDSQNKPIPVIIDTKAPRVTVSGVENGAKYQKAVTVTVEILDSYLDTDSIQAAGWTMKTEERKTKDGLEYTKVTLKRKYMAPGKHIIDMRARDFAGNEGKNEKISFTMDVKKNDHPDDNADVSSEPLVIGDDTLGPDELQPDETLKPSVPKGPASPVAILDGGYADEMAHLLGTINVPFDLVDPSAGTEEFYPHKLLIIPTDGLATVADNPFWRGKLELFAKQGGTILCYGQQSGKAYGLLPGQPKGYGWSEDQACWYGSSYFELSAEKGGIHPVFAGQKDNLVDAYADGYFVTWPQDAQILLYRAVNHFPVAMVYPFGLGKVIATALYPDWGHMNNQYSQEEALLFRNTIRWALNPDDPALKIDPTAVARSPAVAKDFLAWITSDSEEVPKGNWASFTFHLRNTSEKPQRFFAHYFLPHNARVNKDPVYGVITLLPGGNGAVTSTLNKTFDLAPGQETEFTHAAPIVADFDEFWVHLYQGEVRPGNSYGFGRGIYGVEPDIDVEFFLDKPAYAPGEMLHAKVRWKEGFHVRDGFSWDTKMMLEIRSADGKSIAQTQWDQTIGSKVLEVPKNLGFPAALEDFTGKYQAVLTVYYGSQKLLEKRVAFDVSQAKITLDVLADTGATGLHFRLASQEASETRMLELRAALLRADGSAVASLQQNIGLAPGTTQDVPMGWAPPLPEGNYSATYECVAQETYPKGSREFTSRCIVDAHATKNPDSSALKVQVKVLNAGDFYQEGLKIRLASEELGTTESPEFAVGPGQSKEISLVMGIPEQVKAGQHALDVTLNSGASQKISWDIHGPALEFALSPEPVAAGGELLLNIKNTGDFSTAFDAQLLLSGMGTDVDLGKRTQTLAAGAEMVLHMAVPADLAPGPYAFYFFASDGKQDEAYRFSAPVRVDAPQIRLTLSADRDSYLKGQQAQITAEIAAPGQQQPLPATLALSLKNRSPDTPDTWEKLPLQPKWQSATAADGAVWYTQEHIREGSDGYSFERYYTVGRYDSGSGQWYDYPESAISLKSQSHSFLTLDKEIWIIDPFEGDYQWDGKHYVFLPPSMRLYHRDKATDRWISVILDAKAIDILRANSNQTQAFIPRAIGDEVWILPRLRWNGAFLSGKGLVRLSPGSYKATGLTCSKQDAPAQNPALWTGDMPAGPVFSALADTEDPHLVWVAGQSRVYTYLPDTGVWQDFFSAASAQGLSEILNVYPKTVWAEGGAYTGAFLGLDKQTQSVRQSVSMPYGYQRILDGDYVWGAGFSGGKVSRLDMRTGAVANFPSEARGPYIVNGMATGKGVWFAPFNNMLQGWDFLDRATLRWTQYSEQKGNALLNNLQILPDGDALWGFSPTVDYSNGRGGFDHQEIGMLSRLDSTKGQWSPLLRSSKGLVGPMSGPPFVFDKDIWLKSLAMVMRWLPREDRWEYYHPLNSGLPDREIRGIANDGEKYVWFCSRQGVARFDRETRDWKTFLIKDIIPSSNFPQGCDVLQLQVTPQKIWALLREDKNYGLPVFYAAEYDKALETWKTHRLDTPAPVNGFTTKILADEKGLWALQTNGVLFLDGRTGEARYFSGSDAPLLGEYANDLFVDQDDVWVTTLKGVARYEKSSEKWSALSQATSQLPTDSVQTIVRIGDNAWFGSSKGLSRLDLTNGAWTHDASYGWVQSIGKLEDGSGRVWVGSYPMLTLVDADGHILRRYDEKSNPPVTATPYIYHGQPWIYGSRFVFGEDHSKPVWEENIPVTIAGTQKIARQTPPLASPGRYDLSGELRSSRGQVLATAQNVFYVTDGKFLLEFSPDKSVYRVGEQAVFSCAVTNLLASPLPDVPVQCSIGSQEIFAILIHLAPKEKYAFQATAGCTASSTAQLRAGDSVLRQEITVEVPAGEAQYVGPEIVGHEPFQAGVRLSNTGKVAIEGTVQIGSEEAPANYRVAPGQSQEFLKTYHVDKDFALDMDIAGDVQQKMAKQIRMVEKGKVTWNIPEKGMEGSTAISFSVQNTGEMPLKAPLHWECTGPQDFQAQEERNYEIPVGEQRTDQWVVNLAAGDYVLHWNMLDDAGEKAFHVMPDKAILELDLGKPVLADGRLIVPGSLVNTGGKDFQGEIVWDCGFARGSQTVAVKATKRWEGSWSTGLAGATAGTYPVTMRVVQSGKVLQEMSGSVTLQQPPCVFLEAPPSFQGKPGQSHPLEFLVRNDGYLNANELLECKIGAFFAQSARVWLEPGQTQRVTFEAGLPAEITPGMYKGSYGFSGNPGGEFDVAVEGDDVSVVAAWDKKEYEIGEQAVLACSVKTLANASRELTTVVRRGDENWSSSFVIGGSSGNETKLEFPIPVHAVNPQLGFEKVLYSLYDKTGHSLYINRIDLPVMMQDLLRLTTDKLEYLPGETVRFTIVSSQPEEVELSAPGYQASLPVQGTVAGSFSLPSQMSQGTFSVDAHYRGFVRQAFFNVRGRLVKILQEQVQRAGKDFVVTLKVQANKPVGAVLHVRWEGMDGNLFSESSMERQLSEGTQIVSLALPVADALANRFRCRYWLRDAQTEELLTGGSEEVSLGGPTLLGMGLEKTTYPEGESIPMKVDAFGFGTTPIKVMIGEETVWQGTMTFHSPATAALNLPAMPAGTYKIAAVLGDGTEIMEREITITPSPPPTGGAPGGGSPSPPSSSPETRTGQTPPVTAAPVGGLAATATVAARAADAGGNIEILGGPAMMPDASGQGTEPKIVRPLRVSDTPLKKSPSGNSPAKEKSLVAVNKSIPPIVLCRPPHIGPKTEEWEDRIAAGENAGAFQAPLAGHGRSGNRWRTAQMIFLGTLVFGVGLTYHRARRLRQKNREQGLIFRKAGVKRSESLSSTQKLP